MTDISFATLATLADTRRLINEPQERNPDDQQADIQIMEALRFATRYIEARTRRSYLPFVETRYFDAGFLALGADASGYDLDLGENRVLEITSVANGDGSSISSNEYRLYPRVGAPYTFLRLSATGWTSDATYGAKQAIAITGRWESSDRGAANWLTGYDAVQNSPLSDSATSITVAWTTDFDPAQRTPRFSPGQLLRLGTSSSAEYVAILDSRRIVNGTSTLTVRRGERGTTAASWTQGTTIAAWEVDDTMRVACAQLAAWVYKNGLRGEDDKGIPKYIDDLIGPSAARYFVRAI